MRVGSKVVCISVVKDETTNRFLSMGYKLPEVGGTYTIRGIQKELGYANDWLLLDEIVNPSTGRTPDGLTYLVHEAGYHCKHFREIDTRPELSELTDEMILTAPATKELQTA